MKKIRNYSAITAHGDVPARKMVLDLMDRVLQEVDSYQRIRDVMHVEGNVLHVGVKSWNLESKRNIYLLGAGKACNAMAQAVCDVLGERITKRSRITTATPTFMSAGTRCRMRKACWPHRK